MLLFSSMTATGEGSDVIYSAPAVLISLFILETCLYIDFDIKKRIRIKIIESTMAIVSVTKK
jgi:hypothetical protein